MQCWVIYFSCKQLCLSEDVKHGCSQELLPALSFSPCRLQCPPAAAIWELPALLMAQCADCLVWAGLQLCPAARLSPQTPSHSSKAAPWVVLAPGRDGCVNTHRCEGQHPGQHPASSVLNDGLWRAFPTYPSLQFLLYLCYVGTSLLSRNPHLSLLLLQILPHDPRT